MGFSCIFSLQKQATSKKSPLQIQWGSETRLIGGNISLQIILLPHPIQLFVLRLVQF